MLTLAYASTHARAYTQRACALKRTHTHSHVHVHTYSHVHTHTHTHTHSRVGDKDDLGVIIIHDKEDF